MARNFVAASSQFINFPSLDSFLSGSTTYSVMLRFKTPDTNFKTLTGHRTTSSTNPFYWNFFINAGALRVNIRGDSGGGGALVLDTSNTFSVDVWNTGGFARNGSTGFAYLNGVEGPVPTTFAPSGFALAQVFDIGAITNGSSSTRQAFFEGDIAEVAVWDVTLTTAEAQSYDAGMSPLLIRPQNLIFYAPLWGTTLEADLVGSGGIGTLNGSPAISGFHAPVGVFKNRVAFTFSAPRVSGFVFNNAGPVARTVRAYSRLTNVLVGETVSDGGDGSYEILGINAELVYVVAISDGARDPIKILDKVIPLQ